MSFMLSVTYKPFKLGDVMLYVVRLSDVMLNVVASNEYPTVWIDGSRSSLRHLFKNNMSSMN